VQGIVNSAPGRWDWLRILNVLRIIRNICCQNCGLRKRGATIRRFRNTYPVGLPVVEGAHVEGDVDMPVTRDSNAGVLNVGDVRSQEHWRRPGCAMVDRA